MAVLLAAHSFLAIWTRPMIGRLIDRLGEQRALSMNYGIVALVFVGYALVGNAWVVYGIFVLDNVLTGFDIGSVSALLSRPHSLQIQAQRGFRRNIWVGTYA